MNVPLQRPEIFAGISEMNEIREGFTQERCPKCGGNVYLDRDFYGCYEKCLQCSYTRDHKIISKISKKVKKVHLRKARGSTLVK